jgi:hypothetical protein
VSKIKLDLNSASEEAGYPAFAPRAAVSSNSDRRSDGSRGLIFKRSQHLGATFHSPVTTVHL